LATIKLTTSEESLLLREAQLRTQIRALVAQQANGDDLKRLAWKIGVGNKVELDGYVVNSVAGRTVLDNEALLGALAEATRLDTDTLRKKFSKQAPAHLVFRRSDE